MRKVKCPKCKETLDVKEEKKYIDCPYCGEEFCVSDKKAEQSDKKSNDKTKEEWKKLFKQ